MSFLPPNGLWQIADRIYVFSHCFCMPVLTGNDLKSSAKHIATQLKEQSPESTFMLVNFGVKDKDYLLAPILRMYGIDSNNFPRQNEKYPLVSLKKIHHCIRISEDWLAKSEQNALLLHSEQGGWPVLVFMLAALLVQLKHYTDKHEALDVIYKQAITKQSDLELLAPLNPIPTQLRYLNYVAHNDVQELSPDDTPLALEKVILSAVPNFDGQGGCRPMFRIYGLRRLGFDSFLTDQGNDVLFCTPKKTKFIWQYGEADKLVTTNVHCHIRGDILLECIHLHDDLQGEEIIFRIMFNTNFVSSGVLRLTLDQMDIPWQAKDRFPANFRAMVLFSELYASPALCSAAHSNGDANQEVPAKALNEVQNFLHALVWLSGKDDAEHQFELRLSYCADKDAKATSGGYKEQDMDVPDVGSDMLKSPLESNNNESAAGSIPLASHEVVSPKLLNNEHLIPDTSYAPPLPSLLPSHSCSSSVVASKPLEQHMIPVPPPLPPKNLPAAHPILSQNETIAAALTIPPPSPLASIAPPSHQQLEISANVVTLSESQKILEVQHVPLPHKTGINTSLTASNVPPPPSSTPSQSLVEQASKVSTLTLLPPPPPPPPTPPPPPPKTFPPKTSHFGSSTNSHPGTVPQAPTRSTIPPPPPPPPVSRLSAPINSTPVVHNEGSKTIPAPPPPPAPPSRPVGSKGSGKTISEKPLPMPPAPPPPPLPLRALNVANASPSPPPPPTDSTLSSAPKHLTPPPPPPPLTGSLPINGPKHLTPPPPPVPPAVVTSSNVQKSNVNVPPPPPMQKTAGASNTVPQPPLQKFSINRTSGTNRLKSLKSLSKNSFKMPLKQLQWSRLARAKQGSLWAQGSEDEIKAIFDRSDIAKYFPATVPTSKPKAGSKPPIHSAKQEKLHLIDLRRSNNVEITLKNIKIPWPTLVSSILSLDESVLDADQVEILLKICPTPEETKQIQDYNGDKNELGICEQFFLAMMTTPRVQSKLAILSFKIMFKPQLVDLQRRLNLLVEASEEIRKSDKLKNILFEIRDLGNELNDGTNRGSAIGFKLESLLKLADVHGSDPKITLMHYLCKVLADKLPEVLDFDKDLANLEPASKIKLKDLKDDKDTLSKDLKRAEEELELSQKDMPVSEIFCKKLQELCDSANEEFRSLELLFNALKESIDALANYFNEDPIKKPFEQDKPLVILDTLSNFVKTFEKSHQENIKRTEQEKKKAKMEAEKEKRKPKVHSKETSESGAETASNISP